MQVDSIIEKARRLGLDTGNSVNQADNLRYIADQLGVEDLSSLESVLDERLQETMPNNIEPENLYDTVNETPDNIQNQPTHFGEKEYQKTVGNKNYYKDEKNKLNENLEENKKAKEEAEKKKDEAKQKRDEAKEQKQNSKGTSAAKGDNRSYKNANKEYKKANKEYKEANRDLKNTQRDIKANKINNIKSKMYQTAHPLEAAKSQLKHKAKSTAKNVGKKAVKKTGEAAVKAVNALIKLATSNPIVAMLLGGFLIILLLLMIFIVMSGGAAASYEEGSSNSYSSACDSMSISSTTLTKSEFVDKLSEYASGSSSKGSKTFAENAESIYDIATSNNINPELVVVRAIKEGFSPGASNNNYWGIGCTNTGGKKACKSYSSFDDGVLAFVENISQYDSVSAMMSRYAYIGSYWYNPGGSGVGGCYYYDYIKEYLSESRSSEVNKVCSSSKSCTTSGGSNCTSTTDEDQLAYAKWQVNGMATLNKNIFGVVPEECKSYSGDCTIYAQGDPKWASTKVGTGGTMSSIGCAVTSIAIGISCSDTPVTVDDFDAGVLVEALNKGKCFSGGNIIWTCSAIQKIAPEVSYVGAIDTNGYSNAQKQLLIDSYPQDQYFILLKIVNSKTRSHYVVYSDTEGENFVTKNPAGGKISNQLIKDIKKIVIYKH